MRESVRRIADGFGHARFAEVGRRRGSAIGLWQPLAEHGFLGVNIPEEYEGGGLDMFELAVVQEEVSAAGCPMLPLLVSPGIAGTVLTRHGTDAQKDRRLRGIGSVTSTTRLRSPSPTPAPTVTGCPCAPGAARLTGG